MMVSHPTRPNRNWCLNNIVHLKFRMKNKFLDYRYSRFLDYRYIFNKYNYGNLYSFQIEMKAYGMPNYIHRYCDGLDKLGWMTFYSKMMVPMEII